jgi:hypothetical protein
MQYIKYILNRFKEINFFELFTVILIILLPFWVILSVFLQFKLGLPKFLIYKEVLIILIIFSLFYLFYKNKIFPKLTLIDHLIFAYIWYLLIISILNWLSIKAFIYWWRYDFEFLIIFLIYRHWFLFLKNKLTYYIKIFIISWWVALIFWILVRFFLWEDILLSIWFSPKLSYWNIGDSIPIYHWIQWANIRRFQWIFDWPNQAAFFIIIYTWLVIHVLKNKKDFILYIILFLFFMIGLLLLTYSRSSILWMFTWLFLIFILHFKNIIKKHTGLLIVLIIIFLFLWWVFFIKYSNTINNIFLRAGSSKWHYERMIIWFDNWIKKPFWAWLASSGPAYRVTHDITNIEEKYYIPESWFIQQLIEWWFIWFTLFLLIMMYILINLHYISTPIFTSFVAILVMNLFLNTF